MHWLTSGIQEPNSVHNPDRGFALEHISEHHINLFKCNENEISRLYIQLKDTSKSFLNTENFDWFINNPLNEVFEYFRATKSYNSERNIEIFKLIAEFGLTPSLEIGIGAFPKANLFDWVSGSFKNRNDDRPEHLSND